jgi:hypothetical protein
MYSFFLVAVAAVVADATSCRYAVEDAYDLVHCCGVVHNDIKPSHILSLSGHPVKIIDWEGGDVEEHDWFGNSFGNKIYQEKRWVRSVLCSA